MIKTIKDADTPRVAARAAAGLGAVAVVAVGLPAVDIRADVQAENNEWRLKARTFVTADPSDRSGDDRVRQLASIASDSETADLRSLVDFQTFAPAHFDHADKQRDEHECLSRAIYYEARNEPVLGQLAVAEVVLNRVRHRLYPNNICDVVYEGTDRETGLSFKGTNASCQFSFTCDGAERNAPRGRTWRRAQQIATHAMLELSSEVTGTATHYHADYVDPYWAPSLVHTRTVGRHIFYRFPKAGERSGRGA